MPLTKRNVGRETNKLASKETDWNLAVANASTLTRTRHGGKGRPNLELLRQKREIIGSSSSESEYEEEEAAVVVEEEEIVPPKTRKKPPFTRVLLEVDNLEEAFQNFLCPSCGEQSLELKLRTVCIATSISFVCKREACAFTFEPKTPAPTTLHIAQNDNYERTTDYAVNVLYVVGFMSMGDAHTEAARLLGLLGLPNDTTMESRSFSIIEQQIGPIMRKLCDEILMENMIEEARLTMEACPLQTVEDFERWKKSLTDKTMPQLTESQMPKVSASYDMAWQQKGSGHVYNSQSGHGTMMGNLTRKIISLGIKSKLCNQCNAYARKGTPVLEHRCSRASMLEKPRWVFR
jgi:hypothetical protein